MLKDARIIHRHNLLCILKKSTSHRSHSAVISALESSSMPSIRPLYLYYSHCLVILSQIARIWDHASSIWSLTWEYSITISSVRMNGWGLPLEFTPIFGGSSLLRWFLASSNLAVHSKYSLTNCSLSSIITNTCYSSIMNLVYDVVNSLWIPGGMYIRKRVWAGKRDINSYSLPIKIL